MQAPEVASGRIQLGLTRPGSSLMGANHLHFVKSRETCRCAQDATVRHDAGYNTVHTSISRQIILAKSGRPPINVCCSTMRRAHGYRETKNEQRVLTTCRWTTNQKASRRRGSVSPDAASPPRAVLSSRLGPSTRSGVATIALAAVGRQCKVAGGLQPAELGGSEREQAGAERR